MRIKPLLIFCFVLFCSLSYGQKAKSKRLYLDSFYVVPVGEKWALWQLNLGAALTIINSNKFFVYIEGTVLGDLYTIRLFGRGGVKKGLKSGTASKLFTGSFPVFLPAGTVFSVYRSFDDYIEVEVENF